MTRKILEEHYERKYSHESKMTSIEVIKCTKIPMSRFEAAVYYFPKLFKGGNILELGSGGGNVTKSLLESNLQISNYTVSEISSTRLTHLRNNLIDNRVQILKIDAENLPEGEIGKYDAVIMIALIEHLIDPIRTMQHIRKLLKPGGFVYVDTENIAKYTRRIKLLFGRFPSTASQNEGLTTFSGQSVDLLDEGHLHYFTFRSLSVMLTQRCQFSAITKLGYPGGKIVFGKRIHFFLARKWPELFSELALIAYA